MSDVFKDKFQKENVLKKGMMEFKYEMRVYSKIYFEDIIKISLM